MSIFVNIIVFILACGTISCLIAMFYLASQGEKKLNLKNLPSLEPRALLNKSESGLTGDLSIVCEKLGLRSFAKVGLGELLQAKDEDIRQRWREALMAYEVDFAICDPRTYKLLMVILPVEQGAPMKPRHDMVIRAMGKAEIPYLQLGNYNRAGLEKAIKERLEPNLDKAAASAAPAKKGGRPETQVSWSEPEPEPELAS